MPFLKALIPVNRGWSLLAVFFLGFFAPPSPAQNPDPSLIGYWPFDGDGADGSGGNRPLELAARVSFAPGLIGQALSIKPGSVQDERGPAYRPINDPEFDFGANDFTLQAWVKYNQTGGEQVLIEKFSGGGGPGWTLTKYYGGDPNIWQFYAGAPINSPTQTIPAGVWHQVVVRRSGLQLQMFYDHQLVAAAHQGPIQASPNPLLIGMRNKGDIRGSFITDGLIDEVAIWNGALDDVEIDALFNGGAGRKATDLGPGVQPPQGLSAIPGDRQVALSWAAPVSGGTVAGYHVYRTKPGPEERLTTTPVTDTQYTAANLREGTSYCFIVRAVGEDGGESRKSSEACALTPGSPDITAGLLGYWQFDGDGQDCSESDRPLELAAQVGFAPGLYGQALSVRPGAVQGEPGPAFRPVDDPEFDFGSSDFTIQAWINYNNLVGEQVLIEKFTGLAGPGWTLSKREGNWWHFYMGGSVNSSQMTIDPGVWHQVVVRRSGAALEILFDHTSIARQNISPIPDSNDPLLIGMRNKGDGRGFITDGLIDEVAIWNRALDDSEIDFLYNGGFGKPALCRSGSISVSSNCGFIPLEVQFSLETTLTFTSVLWQFGDGTTSADLQPAHVYLQPGSYAPMAVLTVTEGGEEVVFEGGLVRAYAAPPQAEFSFSPAAGPAPLRVQFTDRSAGEVAKRRWEFGDGGTSAESNPAHTYAAPGVYPVKLTASGPCIGSPGNDSTALDQVTAGSLPYVEWVQTGPHCVAVVLTNTVAIKGGEIGFAYDPGAVMIAKVKAGSDFPDNGDLRFNLAPGNNCLPEENVSAGLTLGWINSLSGNILTPPGKHELFKICFNLAPGAPLGSCSPLRFVDCLGVAGAPARNIVTSQNGSSAALFTQDGEVCVLNDLPFRRGDANGDGDFDISDPIVILTCLFLGTDCSRCPDTSDADDDGVWDITDAINLLYWRFSISNEPSPPFPGCGTDPTSDEIDDCEVYLPCR